MTVCLCLCGTAECMCRLLETCVQLQPSCVHTMEETMRSDDLVVHTCAHVLLCVSCDGLLPQPGFRYIAKLGGIATTNDYPYVVSMGLCTPLIPQP